MSEKALSLLGIAVSVLLGVPAWWTLFIEHPETLHPAMAVLRVVVPVAIFLLGCFTGYHLKAWRNGADRYRTLARRVPSLSAPERAILLIACGDGAVWAGSGMEGPASSLCANGYLVATYSGGLNGECYAIPGELREAIANRKDAMEALNEVEGMAHSMVSRRG